MSYCKGCGAIVHWITTPRGQKMPLDNEQSSAEDNLVFSLDGDIVKEGMGHKSHFATCPAANKFRGKR